MIIFKDKHFCVNEECIMFKECRHALNEHIKNEATLVGLHIGIGNFDDCYSNTNNEEKDDKSPRLLQERQVYVQSGRPVVR